jgi:hypothetical protein
MHTIMHATTVVRPVVSTVTALGRFFLPKGDEPLVKTVTKGSCLAGGDCCRIVALKYGRLVTCLSKGLFY